MTITKAQFQIRKMQLENRRESGELPEWKYRLLLEGLRVCLPDPDPEEAAGVTQSGGYGSSKHSGVFEARFCASRRPFASMCCVKLRILRVNYSVLIS